MVSKLANIHEYIILCYIPNKNFDSLSGGVCVCVCGGGGSHIELQSNTCKRCITSPVNMTQHNQQFVFFFLNRLQKESTLS